MEVYWRAWRLKSRLGRRCWRKIRLAAVGGLAAAGQELHVYTVPLQIVSESLSGESPPATIIANVDMLIGPSLRSPTITLGC